METTWELPEVITSLDAVTVLIWFGAFALFLYVGFARKLL